MDFLNLIFSPQLHQQPEEEQQTDKKSVAKRSPSEQKKLADAYKKLFATYVPLLIIPEKGLKLEKEVFLMRRDANVMLLLAFIRQKLSLRAEEAMFAFIKKSIILTGSSRIGKLYDEHADGSFLIINVCLENTFG